MEKKETLQGPLKSNKSASDFIRVNLVEEASCASKDVNGKAFNC